MNNNIPINKGHFDLDTQERIAEFRRKMAIGWNKTEYEKYRKEWEELPKKRIIRDYPLQVDLELSTVCNLKCPMCYTISSEYIKKVQKRFMDLDLYNKIIDEISGKVYAIRLSLRGESTLHPNFIKAIEYAKQKGIKEVSSLTNSSTLTLDFFKKIANAGLDWLTVSIDGINEEYENIRKPLKFKDTFQKLLEIKKYKIKEGIEKPVVKIQGIWPAIRKDPTKYYNTLSPVCDLISFNPLIDYLYNDKDIVYENNFCCPQIYERLIVGSDGKVMLCGNDTHCEHSIGNVNESTIHEMWHSKKMNDFRKLQNSRNGFKQYKICRQCYYPRKMIPDETAKIGDRNIIVENYVNRKQKVGE